MSLFQVVHERGVEGLLHLDLPRAAMTPASQIRGVGHVDERHVRDTKQRVGSADRFSTVFIGHRGASHTF